MLKGFFSLDRASVPTAAAVLLLFGMLAYPAAAQQGSVRNDIHLLRSRVFHFPVTMDRALIAKTKEVSLYMRDGPAPAPWVLVATVPPAVTPIRCQVPHDGEFSFQLVTVDLLSRPSIPDLTRVPPAMTILVDTTGQGIVQVGSSEPQTGGGAPSQGYPSQSMPNGPLPGYQVFPQREPEGSPPTTVVPSTAPSTIPPYTPPPPAPVKSYPASYSTTTTSNPAISIGPSKLVNTTRVGIDYNVARAGSSGVAKIDVWMTPDGGRSWQRIGEETNHRNPIYVDLPPSDGIFGIRLVATNGNGFGGRPPASGDQPSITFELDLQAPLIHLLEPETMSKNGVLDIRWKVTDKNLAAEPINLYYSAQRSGPWIPIVSKHRNDDVYHWQLPRDVPPQLFFRLEAVDMAGNVAKCDTQTPINLDTTQPEIEVLGIQPVPTHRSPSGN